MMPTAGAERHPAQEDHQDDDLGVRAMSNEQAEIPAPERLVDQAGGAAEDEDGDEDGEHQPCILNA